MEFEIKKLRSIQYQNTKSNTHGLVKEFAWNGLITLFLVTSPLKKSLNVMQQQQILQMLCDNYIKSYKIKLKQNWLNIENEKIWHKGQTHKIKQWMNRLIFQTCKTKETLIMERK